MINSHHFKAFDTDVLISAVFRKEEKGIMEKIEKSAREFERRFSRFDGASELNIINQGNGVPLSVSEEMIEVLLAAKKAYADTRGLFDPTVLGSLTRIGYGKSFGTPQGKKSEPYMTSDIKAKFRNRITFDELKIDSRKMTVKPPAGFGMDLGGIAKGYWVDKAGQILREYSRDFWVSAGGDIYITGRNEDGSAWEVGVQNPVELGADILSLHIPPRGLGIATSGIAKRQGQAGNLKWHHLIDPRTGVPARNSVLAVTVIGPSAMKADVMAKTTLILGIKKGLVMINGMRDYECAIIDRRLKIHLSNGMKTFL